jgi:hypothetical protein
MSIEFWRWIWLDVKKCDQWHVVSVTPKETNCWRSLSITTSKTYWLPKVASKLAIWTWHLRLDFLLEFNNMPKKKINHEKCQTGSEKVSKYTCLQLFWIIVIVEISRPQLCNLCYYQYISSNCFKILLRFF